MDDMTWKAAMDSEIFREFVKNEASKVRSELIAQKKIENKLAELKDDEPNYYDMLDQLESTIRANPALFEHFKQARKALQDPEIIKTADPDFIKGMMMLDLDD